MHTLESCFGPNRQTRPHIKWCLPRLAFIFGFYQMRKRSICTNWVSLSLVATIKKYKLCIANVPVCKKCPLNIWAISMWKFGRNFHKNQLNSSRNGPKKIRSKMASISIGILHTGLMNLTCFLVFRWHSMYFRAHVKSIFSSTKRIIHARINKLCFALSKIKWMDEMVEWMNEWTNNTIIQLTQFSNMDKVRERETLASTIQHWDLSLCVKCHFVLFCDCRVKEIEREQTRNQKKTTNDWRKMSISGNISFSSQFFI